MDRNEDDPEAIRRLLEELYQTSRLWRWMALGIAIIAAVAAMIAQTYGAFSAAVLCAFVAFMMGLVSIGNTVLARWLARERAAHHRRFRQEQADEPPVT